MFPNLEAEMAREKITQAKLADILGITPTTLSLKLNGKGTLSLKECVTIKNNVFPDKTLDYLFQTLESTNQPQLNLSVNKVENGFADCDVRLVAGHKTR